MNEAPKNCIALCRVSDPRQAREGDSLENQERIALYLAERKHWNMVKIFMEPYSGRTNPFAIFEDIIDFIKTSESPVHYCIIKGIDRFVRAGFTEYQAMKLRLEKVGVEVVDSYGIIQPKQNTLEHLGHSYDWSVYSPSEAAEMLEAHRAKQEVRDILTRMIGAEIRLVQEGYHVGPPLDGFVNKRIYVDGKKKVIEIPDPDRAPFFTKAFNLRAQSTLTDKEIVEQINAMGYRSKKRKRWDKKKKKVIGYRQGVPLSVKQLQKLIQHPRYCGVSYGKWTHYQPIRAQYPGLVSIDTFNQANRGKIFIKEHNDGSLEICHDYSPWGKIKRLRNNPLYPFKFILCPFCRKPFTASSPKGKAGRRYPTYHCARTHKYYGVSKKEFEDTIRRFISNVQLTPAFLDSLELTLLDKHRERQKEVTATSARINRNVADLKAQQAAVLEKLLATESKLVREKLEAEIEKLEQQIDNAEDEQTGVDIKEQDIKAFIRYARYLMEHPAELLLDTDNMQAQRALFGLVFEETPTYHEILNGTPKLSLIFKLSEDFKRDKSRMVHYEGLGWNTLERLIQKWNAVFRSFDLNSRLATKQTTT